METNSGVSPRAGRVCDNDKQAGSNKVRVFSFVIKGNLSCGEICHAENLGNAAIPKKVEFRIRRKDFRNRQLKMPCEAKPITFVFSRKTWECVGPESYVHGK